MTNDLLNIPYPKKHMRFSSFFSAWILSWILFPSCSEPPVIKPDHPAYFNPVFQKAENFKPGEGTQALQYLDSVYAGFKDPGPMDLAWKYEFKMNYYWITESNVRLSRLYADSILFVLKGLTDNPEYGKEYGKTLLQIGDFLRDQGKFSDAFTYYYEGHLFIQKSGDTCSYNEYSQKIAMVLYKQKKYVEAIPYFRNTFIALNSCVPNEFYRFRLQQADLDNIGLCYERLEKPDSALFYYDSALQYITLHKAAFQAQNNQREFVEEAKAVIYGNKGSVLGKQGNTTEAEKLYQESIRINMISGRETKDAQLTIAKLVELYLSQQKFPDARNWLQTLRHSLDSFPSNDSELLWLKLQSKYFSTTSNPTQALTMLNRYLQLKDSLTSINNPLNFIDMQKEFDHLTGAYELSLLKKQSEIKTIYLKVSSLLLLMAIIITLLVWQTWKRSGKHLKAVQRLNEQMMSQNRHMKASLEALEQSQLDNSKMLKIIAHDLRNPVAAMMGLAEILPYEQENISDQTQVTLAMMKESGERALSLINELLHMNVTTEMQHEEVQLDVVLEYCVNLLQPKAKEKEQEIRLHAIPVKLQANREKIWRVFSNLITNAIKFSSTKSVIEVDMQQEAQDVITISVKDEGIGIPEDIKLNIFNLSADSRRKGTIGEESFGLGLAISKQIVTAHRGRIWFESEVGKGSVFYVELRNAIETPGHYL